MSCLLFYVCVLFFSYFYIGRQKRWKTKMEMWLQTASQVHPPSQYCFRRGNVYLKCENKWENNGMPLFDRHCSNNILAAILEPILYFFPFCMHAYMQGCHGGGSAPLLKSRRCFWDLRPFHFSYSGQNEDLNSVQKFLFENIENI